MIPIVLCLHGIGSGAYSGSQSKGGGKSEARKPLESEGHLSLFNWFRSSFATELLSGYLSSSGVHKHSGVNKQNITGSINKYTGTTLTTQLSGRITGVDNSVMKHEIATRVTCTCAVNITRLFTLSPQPTEEAFLTRAGLEFERPIGQYKCI